MSYEEFKDYLTIGHEFSGILDGFKFSIVHLSEGNLLVIKNDKVDFIYLHEKKIIYKGKTLEELFKENIIEIREMF